MNKFNKPATMVDRKKEEKKTGCKKKDFNDEMF